VEIVIEGQKIIRVYDGKSAAGWSSLRKKKDRSHVRGRFEERFGRIRFRRPFIDYKAKGNQIELRQEELEAVPLRIS